MRILVTGASGFLGRHVVDALRRAGHSVRALIRPTSETKDLGWDDGVEIVRADLRGSSELEGAFDDIDAAIHLAAVMTGSDFRLFSETITATERFLEAMRQSLVTRLVLCSSFSVYDWLQARGSADEDLPLLREPAASGGYAMAKLWQERLARRMCDAYGLELTILRPGFIWGPGNECPPGSIGRSLGPLHFVLSGGRRLPLTHVVNCADSFRVAVETPVAIGQTLNVLDDHAVTAWQFMGEYLRRSKKTGVRVWVPYVLLRPIVGLIYQAARAVLGPRAKLPSLLVPTRFAQGYRPLKYRTERLHEVLGWNPPLSFDQCLRHTFGPGPSGRPA